MEALHARYPFLDAAREAVQAADVDIGEVVVEGGPIVERATGRVTSAIEDGTVGDLHRTPRVELLSYPVARVIVSLVDEPRLTRRYARAEAETAIERFKAETEDATELRSVARERLALSDLLSEFDLAGAIRRRAATEAPAGAAETFAIDVATYLDLVGGLDGNEWRLVNRVLRDGEVTVTRAELYSLLREAVYDRVIDGLPIAVPEEIADALSGPVGDLRERLAEHAPARDIDAVEPDSFPPCVSALIDRVRSGESIAAHSRFALSAFLSTIGMDTDDIVEVYSGLDADEESIRSQIAHLREAEGPAAYPPPSCATMQAYGDCVNMDALCERIVHPLDYYERRLDGEEA